jgi:hypothetical protein
MYIEVRAVQENPRAQFPDQPALGDMLCAPVVAALSEENKVEDEGRGL